MFHQASMKMLLTVACFHHGFTDHASMICAVIEKDGEWGDGVDISAYCSKTGLAVVQIRNQPTTTFYLIGEGGQEIKNARLTIIERTILSTLNLASKQLSKQENYLIFHV